MYNMDSLDFLHPSLSISRLLNSLNSIFVEHTCVDAWWAHMHRFLSVRPSVCHWTKFRLENNSYLRTWSIAASNLKLGHYIVAWQGSYVVHHFNGTGLHCCKSASQSWLVSNLRVIGRCAHFQCQVASFEMASLKAMRNVFSKCRKL